MKVRWFVLRRRGGGGVSRCRPRSRLRPWTTTSTATPPARGSSARADGMAGPATRARTRRWSTASPTRRPTRWRCPARPTSCRRAGGITNGLWYAKAWTYVPSSASGEMFFILLNTYDGVCASGGPCNWSIQVAACRTGCVTTGVNPGSVTNLGGSDVAGGGSTSLLTDQWVELIAEINLDANTYTVYYNGVPFDTQQYFGATGAAGHPVHGPVLQRQHRVLHGQHLARHEHPGRAAELRHRVSANPSRVQPGGAASAPLLLFFRARFRMRCSAGILPAL